MVPPHNGAAEMWLVLWSLVASAPDAASIAPEFVIMSPPDGSILPTSSNGTAHLSLVYLLHGHEAATKPGALICLLLFRGTERLVEGHEPETGVRFYKGPLIRRDAKMGPFADGCFPIGEPVTITDLPPGYYKLYASVYGGDASSAEEGVPKSGLPTPIDKAGPIFFGVTLPVSPPPPPLGAFVPTYDWQVVMDGQTVDTGLEVSLSVDGVSAKKARIRPRWQLQLFLDDADCYLRLEVTRNDQIIKIERAAAFEALRMRTKRGSVLPEPECFSLGIPPSAEGEEGILLDPAATVEETDLFNHRQVLVAVPRMCLAGEAPRLAAPPPPKVRSPPPAVAADAGPRRIVDLDAEPFDVGAEAVTVEDVQVEALEVEVEAIDVDVSAEECERRSRRLESALLSEDAWHQLWAERFQCWLVATPHRAALQACFGALGITLAQRFESFLGSHRGGQTRAPGAAEGATEPGCEWVSERLRLPEFPPLPDRFHFTVPPLPRMMPSWQQLHSLGMESAPPHTVRHAVMPMSIGAAAGVLLGAACVAISVRQTLRQTLRQTRVDGSARLGLRKS